MSVIDISEARTIRAKIKDIPHDIAETMVIGEIFGSCSQLHLIALYLSQTGRPAEGGMLHALNLEIQSIAKRLSRSHDAQKSH